MYNIKKIDINARGNDKVKFKQSYIYMYGKAPEQLFVLWDKVNVNVQELPTMLQYSKAIITKINVNYKDRGAK